LIASATDKYRRFNPAAMSDAMRRKKMGSSGRKSDRAGEDA